MPTVLVSEADWLKLGIVRFASGGVDALKVEQMAKDLGCSKSSFYWYFKSRDVYIERLLSHWFDIGTTNFIEMASQIEPVEVRFRSLLHAVFSQRNGKDFMFYLRQYIQQEPKYASILASIETTRIDYLASVLRDSGASPEDANAKAQIIYDTYVGWYERHKYTPLTEREIQEQVEILIKHLNLF